ncbi:hypothetical protein [Aquimarina aquimarini]|uniref:hypothetical protein n=1 Tax=Aquimarina aquimarini TaxID=1191734 RepID=UPI000D561F9D|nr:hypothetical protein [Aquimarina aquimarini]
MKITLKIIYLSLICVFFNSCCTNCDSKCENREVKSKNQFFLNVIPQEKNQDNPYRFQTIFVESPCTNVNDVFAIATKVIKKENSIILDDFSIRRLFGNNYKITNLELLTHSKQNIQKILFTIKEVDNIPSKDENIYNKTIEIKNTNTVNMIETEVKKEGSGPLVCIASKICQLQIAN